MFLNVTNTIGCWKGMAIKFIERIHSSSRYLVKTVLFKLLYTSFSSFLLLWKAPWQGMGSIHLTESITLELLQSVLEDTEGNMIPFKITHMHKALSATTLPLCHSLTT
jgi:hypothetical protein